MKQIAIWNGDREAWENPLGEIDLFSTHSDVYLATWPSSGMTRNGSAYELPTPALHMVDSGSSSWLGLPTPMTSYSARTAEKWLEERRAGNGQVRSIVSDLRIVIEEVLLLPPPNTSSGTGPGEHGTGGPNLQTVAALLPTPAAMNPNDGEGVATWEARRQRVKATGKNGNGFGTPLAIAVQLLPTPTVQDASNTGGPSQFERNTKPLNTEVLLIGAHTSPRLNAGKP